LYIKDLMNTERCLLVYNSSIWKKISKNFACKGSLLEISAGIGTIATLFEAREGIKPKFLEIDTNLKHVIMERGFKCYNNIEQIDELFDGVYT
jgi:hypothetical protein